jgi:hypothetical protein
LGGHIRTDIAAACKDEVRDIDFPLKGFTWKKDTVLIIESKGLDLVCDFLRRLRLTDKVRGEVRGIIIGDFRNWSFCTSP